MNKPELLKELGTRTGTSKKQLETVLKAYHEVLVECVKKDGEAVIGNLGKFKSADTKEKKMTMAFGPAKGKEITIPAGKRITFSASKFFKENIK